MNFSITEIKALRNAVAARKNLLGQHKKDPFQCIREAAVAEIRQLQTLDRKLQQAEEAAEAAVDALVPAGGNLCSATPHCG